jgi:hypothetical protein
MRADPTVWYPPDLYRRPSLEPPSPRPQIIETSDHRPPLRFSGYVGNGRRRMSGESSDYSGPWVSLPGAGKRTQSWLQEQTSMPESLNLQTFFSSEKDSETPSPASSLIWLPVCFKELMALEKALLAEEGNAGSSPSSSSPTEGQALLKNRWVRS